MSTHTLLHDAVLRAANRQNHPNDPSLPSTTMIDQNMENDDSIITRVHSPITSPINQSPRSGSPIPGGHLSSKPSHHHQAKNSSRNQSRVGLRQKREAASKAKQNSLDPLRRFPADVNVRIFTILGLGKDGCGGHLDGFSFSAVKDLLNCGLVCQKWRTSSVINYVWYKLYHQTSYSSSIEEEFQAPTWTRKDSRTEWSKKYKDMNEVKGSSRMIVDDLDNDRPATHNELKRAQWEFEAHQTQDSGTSGHKSFTKQEARAFYKDLGGRKLKDKTGKAWGVDRTGWNDYEQS